jgi:ankyrin repeat protein
LAAANNDVDTTKMLLSAGADPNAFAFSKRETPLKVAVSCKAHDVAKLLREVGGLESSAHPRRRPLHWATVQRDRDVIKELAEIGVDLEETAKKGRTAIHLAALAEDIETIRVLCEVGADIRAQDKDGLSAMHIAVEKRNVEMIMPLKEMGSDVTLRDRRGRTPMNIAVFEMRSLVLIKELLRAGAENSGNEQQGTNTNAYCC